MTLCVVTGTANPALGVAVSNCLHIEQTACDVVRFPDGELRPIVGPMRGGDVYVVEPTGPSVNEHLTELLLLLDACRRAGAARITAVVPYFGYGAQDRRGRAGEAVGTASPQTYSPSPVRNGWSSSIRTLSRSSRCQPCRRRCSPRCRSSRPRSTRWPRNPGSWWLRSRRRETGRALRRTAATAGGGGT